MKKNVLLRKLMITVSALCLSAGFILAAPAATISAQAKTLPGISTQEAEIGYVYMIDGNKLYKRQYNYSTQNYIGDWIFVRYL